MEQFFRDQKELSQIKAEELRLQAQQMRAAAESEEAQQCAIGLEALKDQRNALWECLADQLATQKRQQQGDEGEGESTVEITMDTSEMDVTVIMSRMDTTVVEQGKLPAAAQTVKDSL